MATRKPTFEDLPPEVERNEENLELWETLTEEIQRRIVDRAEDIVEDYEVNTIYLIGCALYAGA